MVQGKSSEALIEDEFIQEDLLTTISNPAFRSAGFFMPACGRPAGLRDICDTLQ